MIERSKESRSWIRPFHWGAITLCDPGAYFDVPEIDGSEIVSTGGMIMIPVRHAQDVETSGSGDAAETVAAEVSVTCVLFDEQPAGKQWHGTIACPTGRLEVGDADAHEAFDVPPGSISVVVDRDEEQFAERVTIWLYLSA